MIDSLGHTATLDHRAEYPLLGVPVAFRSNSPAVIAATARAFGQWSSLPPELVMPRAPLLVDVVVHDAPSQPAPFVQRMHGGVFLAASGANVLSAQVEAGRALAFVTPQLVADEPQLRYHVLECLALLLVSYQDRTPIHAGALVHNGRAVLLLGQSTAGKSTLCYAGVRAGFGLLAEDVVYVSLAHGLRLWGNPGRIHLLPDAPRHFPELAGHTPQIRANGKQKLAVDVAGSAVLQTERGVLCLLQRHPDAQPVLERLPLDAAAALALPSEAGFDLHQHQHRTAVAALAAQGVYRLTVGPDLAAALELLRSIA